MKNLTNKLIITLKAFLAASIIAAGVTSYADDTEVFYSMNVSKPNLLFVLDVSGSMSTNVSTATAPGYTATLVRPIVTSTDDGIQNGSRNPIDYAGAEHAVDNNDSLRLRFINIDIPQGAIIKNAYIQFEASQDSPDNTAHFEVYAESTDNAPATVASFFGGSYYQDDKSHHHDKWLAGDRGEDQRVDVKNVTEDVIDRDGWSENNAIAYHIESKDGQRAVAMFDHPTAAAPTLHIEYEVKEIKKDRLEVMQESLRAVLMESPDNVKVGLLNYGLDAIDPEVNGNYPENRRHHSVSGITFPITDINAMAREVIPTTADVYGLPFYPSATATIREYIADVADSWNHKSYTPIVDSLYEAALYYRGEKIHYGQNLPTINGAHPVTYDGPVVAKNVHVGGRDRATAPKYKTPIESSCQENYIVLMTDGAPTYRDSNWKKRAGPFATIRNTANGPQGPLAAAVPACATAAGVGLEGNCGAELTHYLATHDNLGDPTGALPYGQEGDQFIHTFTIGFGTGAGTDTEEYLKSLATYDDKDTSDGPDKDGYFLATSPEDLAAAFKGILEEVAEPKGTLASPGYSVNVKNGLEHEKDIYIPVFDRKNASRWAGNLKKFKIEDVNGRRLIRGKNGANATDELGGFTSDALDYWSDSPASDPDGRVVQKGGLANKLTDPDARKIYSNLTGDSSVNLSTAANKVAISNIANIDNADLGLPTTASEDYRKQIVNFMRGWENGVASGSGKKARVYMGDMLHSEPLVITYNKGSAAGVGKKQYIFAGTNEGYLHAFDTDTGEEKFAFIPKELLSTLSEPLFLNAGTQVDHKYGVDGAITSWFKGGDDGVLDTTAGDKVVIYFGLRRGGSAFYALDVTDIDQPKLLWKKSAAEHASMGQSWSVPYLVKAGVSSSGTAKEVVVVSAGYDEDEDRDRTDGSGEVDDATAAVTADVGNDILILDANDGSLVWSMPAAMRARITNSIPGGVRVLDTNYNGLVDRMYFADTGGNVWRLDLSEKIGDATSSSVLTKLASLGGTGINSRKFFNEPDVAIMKLNGKTVFAVSVGSGFRAHPMDKTISDNFFVLIDQKPFHPLATTGPETFNTITSSSLAEITISGSGVTQTNSIKDAGIRGWKVNFANLGEKVLGTALAFDGNITFTTLVPEVLSSGGSTASIDRCADPVTQSRFYAIDILSGGAGMDLNLDDSITDDDIYMLTGTEILGKPQVVFTPPDIKPVLDDDGTDTGKKSCTHPVDIRNGKKLSQTTGYDACRLESVYWSDPAPAEQ